MSVFWNRRSFGLFCAALLSVGGLWVSSAAAAAPSNDHFVNAADLGAGVTVTATGSTIDATLEGGEPAPYCQSVAGGKTAWWTWTAPVSGSVTIDTIGSGFDTVLAVYTGTAVHTLNAEACDDDGGGNLQSSATFAVTGGVEYHIQVDGYAGESGAVRVNADLARWVQLGGDIDGEANGDESGNSVAFSADGRTVAIGAWENDGSGSGAGHVRVYNRVGTAWVQVGGDIDGEEFNDESGYSVALSADGARVAIGAPSNDSLGFSTHQNAGQVRVYDLVGSAWVQVGADIDGEAAWNESGYSVALSADGATVAIGAPNNGAGHVRVHRLVGVAWVQVGGDIVGEAAGDDYGHSVSLSADGATVAIGAPLNYGNCTGYCPIIGGGGHVRVFDLVGSAWVQIGSDIDGEKGGDFSGGSVALSADGATVAIGARGNPNNSFFGHVRVYAWSGSAWVQVGGDIDGEALGDESGYSVALSADGTTVATGAIGNDGSNTSAGHVRVHKLVGAAWVQVGGDIDGEGHVDKSGWAVALSADGATVAIGAPLNDGTGVDAGHVRVYRFGRDQCSGVTSWPVETAFELNAAIGCFNAATTPGSYAINVVGDVVMTWASTAIDNTTAGVSLTVEGLSNTVDAAGHGSVFTVTNGDVTFANVTLTGGDAASGGGLNNSDVVLLTNSTVSGNNASNDGGGITNWAFGTLTVVNSTISTNSATYKGGGIFNFSGEVTAVYSTITANSASDGAGVWSFNDGPTVTEVAASIVAGNTGGNELVLNAFGAGTTNTFSSGGYNIIGSGNTGGLANFNQPGDLTNQFAGVAGLADNGGPAFTHLLLPGALAIDHVTGSPNLFGQSAPIFDQRYEARPAGPANDAGSVEVAVPKTAWPDFDGLGDADQSVWRRSVGAWYVQGQATSFLGLNGDVPVPADYDGDGDTDKSVWRPSTGQWFVAGQPTTFLGLNGDVPVPADYDGDGDADKAVWRPSTGQWFVPGQPTVYYGVSTDIPVPADYDGDGDADRAVFRKSVGGWYVKDQATVFFGLNGDVPVPGDFDGDGDADKAIWRPAVGGWYVQGQTTAFIGLNGDVPVAADYDGNGTLDRAIWRPSVGGWYVQGQPTVFYGLSTDIPLPIPAAVHRAIFTNP